MGCIMKVHFRTDEKRSGRSALLEVLAILMVAMLAKLGTAVLLVHLYH
jgi:hypothetical protein